MLAVVTSALAFYGPLRSGGLQRSVFMSDRVFSPSEAKGGAQVQNDKTALLFIECQLPAIEHQLAHICLPPDNRRPT